MTTEPAIGDYVEVYDPMDETVRYNLLGILISKRKKHPFHTWLESSRVFPYMVYEVLCNGKLGEFDEPYWAIRSAEEK